MSRLSVRAAAREAPGAPALITAHQTLCWQRLAERVLARAGALRQVAAGARGLRLTPLLNEESVIEILAGMEIGCPLLLEHPKWTSRQRREYETLTPGYVEAGAGTPPNASALPLPAPPLDERPLAIVPTSGSTGAPRGVVLSRAAFDAAARASEARLGWLPEDAWLACLPLSHVGGLSILIRCLHGRRAIVLPSSTDSLELARWLGDERVTLVSLVPAQLDGLLDTEPPATPGPRLRAVLLGGGAAPASLLQRAAAVKWPVLPTYGLTEACSQVATVAPGRSPSPEEGCGAPLPGVEVRVVDGRIEVRSGSLLSGYLPPDPPPPIDEEGWLRTGDLGRLDGAGRLHVKGRADELLVSGGENVAPAAVEEVLRELPGVADALVFGLADERWGVIVAALLVSPPGTPPPSPGELLSSLEGRLPSFARPRRIAWVDRLPLGPTGKPDRRAAANSTAELTELT